MRKHSLLNYLWIFTSILFGGGGGQNYTNFELLARQRVCVFRWQAWVLSSALSICTALRRAIAIFGNLKKKKFFCVFIKSISLSFPVSQIVCRAWENTKICSSHVLLTWNWQESGSAAMPGHHTSLDPYVPKNRHSREHWSHPVNFP